MSNKGFSFEGSFAGVPIDITATSVSHGRAVVPHTFPKRSGANLEDEGRDPFVTQIEFIFIDRPLDTQEDGNYETRFDKFDNLVEAGEVRTLIHPHLGAVRCRISAFDYNSDATGQPAIRCSATFTEEIREPPVFAAGAGGNTTAGSQEVRGSAVSADNSLADEGLSSAVTAAAVSAAEAWELEPELSSRDVQTEAAGIISRLNDELATFSAGTDIDRYPILRDYTLLQADVRRAAEAFTSTTARIINITVRTPLPLRVIAARFYGADQVDERFDEMRELNPQIKNPALIPAGNVLKGFSPTPSTGRVVTTVAG